jgi:hypothetical protein
MKKFMHSTDEMTSLITIQGISALLEKMSPDRLQEFVAILSKGSQYSENALRTFVKEPDELYPIYQAFWKEHSIRFAYGNNSKNFVLTSKQDVYKIQGKAEARRRVEQFSPAEFFLQETFNAEKAHAPCFCGSGEKYKKCCLIERSSRDI